DDFLRVDPGDRFLIEHLFHGRLPLVDAPAIAVGPVGARTGGVRISFQWCEQSYDNDTDSTSLTPIKYLLSTRQKQSAVPGIAIEVSERIHFVLELDASLSLSRER